MIPRNMSRRCEAFDHMILLFPTIPFIAALFLITCFWLLSIRSIEIYDGHGNILRGPVTNRKIFPILDFFNDLIVTMTPQYGRRLLFTWRWPTASRHGGVPQLDVSFQH